MNGNIQLCAFDYEGVGIDTIAEANEWYATPKYGKEAARVLMEKHAEIERIWVRKINAGHMRTVSMEVRPALPRYPGEVY